MSVYYGKAAYEGFARAFGQKLGVNVTVGSGQNACVDGSGNISLPDMNTYQTKEEFENTCATIVHEVAHVYFGSHSEFETQSKYMRRDRLWMDCLNAVMDVADETGIGYAESVKGNHRPGELLVKSNIKAWNENYRAFSDPNHPLPHWQVLATGIIRASVSSRQKRHIGGVLARTHPNVPVKECYDILTRARLVNGKNRKRWNHRQLVTMADKLAEKLKPLEPPQGSPDTPSLTGNPVEAGVDQVDLTDTVATILDGAALALQGGSSQSHSNEWSLCEQSRDMLLPIVKRIASRIAVDGDSIERENGYTSGTGVMDAYRVLTDGACMGKWMEAPHADGISVAVLLDVSGSMSGRMPECAGAAEAFSLGMKECAEVRQWTFGIGSDPCENFEAGDLSGSTDTDKALEYGTDWLKTREGKKLIVCITDGCPSNRYRTILACNEAAQHGISLVAVGLGEIGPSLRETMPGATICTAQDATRLAIELGYISLQV